MATTATNLNINFKPAELDAIWEKANPASTQPAVFRKDAAGAWIKRSDYGRQDSEYGWEVDHIKPLSKNGETKLYNLRPLLHQYNASKGDSYPIWKAAVTADDNGHNKPCSMEVIE